MSVICYHVSFRLSPGLVFDDGCWIENKKVELRVFTSVGFSDPSILIVYSGDIVLAKVTSRLHLNDF